jgi:hypothetical protein
VLGSKTVAMGNINTRFVLLLFKKIFQSPLLNKTKVAITNNVNSRAMFTGLKMPM